MKSSYFSLLLLIVLMISACSPRSTKAPDVSYDALSESEKHQAEHALASFEVAEGLQVEMFAKEPMMINPTNMDIDHLGRVWICEARNYRLPHNQSHEARPDGDRILILEDRDGDGKADHSQVFYQGNDINAALGIGVFDNKVVVSASPQILVLHDDDRDGVADRKDTLFAGISGIDDDHGAHAFTFGPDGRFYFNFGNNGKQIGDKNGNILLDKWGRKLTNDGTHFRQGLAFRCEEDGSNVEVLGHNFRNIFEIAVDSYGNLVQSDNDDDGNKAVRINYIIEGGNYGYQDQVTGAGWRERRVNMNPEIPLRHWHLNDPGVIPNMLQTGAGSPTGMAIYEGDLLPDIYFGQSIHGEPGQQVVRAYLMQPEGMGYRAEIKNILKSEDKWFRPSDVTVGPDGSLFIADWYDAVVGGNGMDDIERGRIYRIAPDAAKYEVPSHDFSTAQGAIVALQSPNMSTRYVAWHALKKMGQESKEVLAELSESPRPHLRVRALWLQCQQPGQLDAAISQSLQDEDLQVQLAGIRMIRYFKGSFATAYLNDLEWDLSEPAIRRELALTLTHDCLEEAVNLWTKLASYYTGEDRWELEILGLITDECPDTYFQSWVRSEVRNQKAQEDLIWRIHSRESLPLIEQILLDKSRPVSELRKFVRALHFKPDGGDDILLKYLAERGDEEGVLQDVLLSVDPKNLQKNSAARAQIIRNLDQLKGSPEWFAALRDFNQTDRKDELWNLMMEGDDDEMRRQAGRTLVEMGQTSWLTTKIKTLDHSEYLTYTAMLGAGAGGEMVDFLIAELNRSDQDLATQKSLIKTLGSSWDGQHRLYDMIKARSLPDALLMPATVQVMNSWDSKIRNEGPAILASLDEAQYGSLPDIVGLSRKTGDATAGADVFKKQCSTCHQVEGEGIRFGPDLSGIGDKLSVRGLYQAIVFPSAGINFGFEGVQVMTDEGDRFQGYIESETSDEILIRTQSGNTKTLARSQIQEIQKLEKSLMTEGLHHGVSQSELVDLVQYLTNLKSAFQSDI